MRDFRCELLSDAQLAELAAAPLPSIIKSRAPHFSWHRDIYLDTPDEALRRRGVSCRFRLRANARHLLSLTLAPHGARTTRVEAVTGEEDPKAALMARNSVAQTVRSILDPSALEARADVEVERITRFAYPDWLRRPLVELHFDRCTVRRNGELHSFRHLCAHHRRDDGRELATLLDVLQRDHGLRTTTTSPRDSAEVSSRWLRPREQAGSEDGHRVFRGADMTAVTSVGKSMSSDLDPELSLLQFQRRVVAMAEDERTPLRERLRFLAIVSANVDEFYMVRMATLRLNARAPESSADAFVEATSRLEAADELIREIIRRQEDCLRTVLPVLASCGVRLRNWRDLEPEQGAWLREDFRARLLPELTPMAMTLSPGHPVPHLPHHTLALAVVFRAPDRGRPHFAELELPADAARFISIPGEGADVITLEEVIRGNLDLLYPTATVEHAHLFRVTRGGSLDIDEAGADDLLDAVEQASHKRRFSAAVRLEVERGMPPLVREMVLENLRRERGADEAPLDIDDASESDLPLDLRALFQLPLPKDPALEFPPLVQRDPFQGVSSLFDEIRRGDRLVHHPFDRFDSTVVRLLREAADDPDVSGIKITLYRVGNESPVIDALLRAARNRKSVAVFIELKARFDEDTNVSSARALEAAGAKVVRGLVGLKNHAKLALIIRRENGKAQRYVHIGTGNYSAKSGEQYTDLSLFSARDDLTADVADLFNELTGTSRPPQRLEHGALIAPHQLLPALLGYIEHEAAIARAGRPARITIKINGLSDEEVVRALYRASGDGVEIDLIVRGICTLRPGVPGLSDRIRVLSVVGRLLEHSRIYRFHNDGDSRFFIGSADLRPRNLRRRVELLVPIPNASHRAQLDEILGRYLADETAWELRADGEYVRRPGEIGAQQGMPG